MFGSHTGKRGGQPSWVALLFLTISLAGTTCIRFHSQEFTDITLDSRQTHHQYPKKETVEWVLSEIWNSGFLVRDDDIRREITNNSYGIFKKSNNAMGRACFSRKKGQKDKILLNKRLFAQVKMELAKEAYISNLDNNIQGTLIHELFHDFWYNLLTEDEKVEFTEESIRLYASMENVVTSTDKLMFLRGIGDKSFCEYDYTSFEKLKLLEAKYPRQKFFGTEMFSILAELVYSGEIVIPLQLKRFYRGLISEATLGKRGTR